MTIKLDPSNLKSWDHLSREERMHLEAIARSISQSKKVITVTGAGISCNAGIPDFRSKDGLYNMVKQQHPNTVVKGKDLFDVVLFGDEATTSVFFTFMAQLRKCTVAANPTPTHKFLRLLKDKKKLLRCYTQNIDGLEGKIGLTMGGSKPLEQPTTSTGKLPKDRSKKLTKAALLKQIDVVQLHGDIHSLKCGICNSVFGWTESYEKLCYCGESPSCPSCEEKNSLRQARGMRHSNVGNLRPNIVLYGEEHPYGDLIGTCVSKDALSRPDVMLIIGTSMKVVGLKKLIKDVAKAVKHPATPRKKKGIVVLINKTDVGLSGFEDVIDYHIKSDCDDWVMDLKTRIPNLFSIQTTLEKYAVPSINCETVIRDEVCSADSKDICAIDEITLVSPDTPIKQTVQMENVMLPTPPTSVCKLTNPRTRSEMRQQNADPYFAMTNSTSMFLSPPATPVVQQKGSVKFDVREDIETGLLINEKAASRNTRLLNEWSKRPLSKEKVDDVYSEKGARKRKSSLEDVCVPVNRNKRKR